MLFTVRSGGGQAVRQELADEIRTQERRLGGAGIEFEVWD